VGVVGRIAVVINDFPVVVPVNYRLRRLDSQLKVSHKRIRDAVRASATSLTDLFGVGADPRRDPHRQHRRRHPIPQPRSLRRLQRHCAGRVLLGRSSRAPIASARDHRLNHAIHMVAICQLRQPHSEGRADFDRRVAEGKTNKKRSARCC
jgi:transposase